MGGENPAIIQKNIEHYRRLLKTETDAAKRSVIAKLLAEAIGKLRESGTQVAPATTRPLGDRL